MASFAELRVVRIFENSGFLSHRVHIRERGFSCYSSKTNKKIPRFSETKPIRSDRVRQVSFDMAGNSIGKNSRSGVGVPLTDNS